MDSQETQILEVGDLIGKEVIRTIDEQMFVLSSIQKKESSKKLEVFLKKKMKSKKLLSSTKMLMIFCI